jgi:hypothetical protein
MKPDRGAGGEHGWISRECLREIEMVLLKGYVRARDLLPYRVTRRSGTGGEAGCMRHGMVGIYATRGVSYDHDIHEA